MDVYDAINQRTSVRSYRPDPVDEDKLERILNAARLAPSGKNGQPWIFIVVKDKGTRKKLVPACKGQEFMAEAPVVIVACAKTDNHIMACGQLCYPIDVAIALDHITLAAVDLNLGTCWIGAFDEGKVKALLSIPDAVRVVGLMPLGYPVDASPRTKNRLSHEEIVKFDRW